MALAEFLVRKYAGKYAVANHDYTLPKKADLIMKATHGATRVRLANGSTATSIAVEKLVERYPDAEVFFSIYTHNPQPDVEEKITQGLLLGSNCVGSVKTTSAEAMALRRLCSRKLHEPQCMVIVTDEFNSKRTRDIYQVFFPNTEIAILAVPAITVVDIESPIQNFRNINRAFLWETAIPCIPFWILARTGWLGKKVLIWMSERIKQTPAKD